MWKLIFIYRQKYIKRSFNEPQILVIYREKIIFLSFKDIDMLYPVDLDWNIDPLSLQNLYFNQY